MGILLAKVLAKPFVDTDIELQNLMGVSLQDYLNLHGVNALRKAEEKYVESLELAGHVISTGGSVIYGERAMESLKKHNQIIYLEVSIETMISRLGDYSRRGIAADLSEGLEGMYCDRKPLYERFADIIIDANQPPEVVLQNILRT